MLWIFMDVFKFVILQMVYNIDKFCIYFFQLCFYMCLGKVYIEFISIVDYLQDDGFRGICRCLWYQCQLFLEEVRVECF